MIDQINELPEDGLKSSPETLHYTENKWIGRKNQNKGVSKVNLAFHPIEVNKVRTRNFWGLCGKN